MLDVPLHRAQPVRVRFTLHRRGLSEASRAAWFEGLMHHLQQPGCGAPEAPDPADACPLLLVEDFNTTGLVGDYRAPHAPVYRTANNLPGLPTYIKDGSTVQLGAFGLDMIGPQDLRSPLRNHAQSHRRRKRQRHRGRVG